MLRVRSRQLTHLWILGFALVASQPFAALPYDNKINENTRSYWAFQRIGRPNPPSVNDAAWNQNPIDAYIHDRLDSKELTPNPPATRRELIRRAAYDLTGLPPNPARVRAFARDNSPNAYERLIDELLASPRYGEKWGRHWLDLARYAETDGYERDNPKPNAWRYRDYVIRSFNDDKPFDQFVREQIAGDELDRVTPESIVATGFQRLGLWNDEPVDADQSFYDGLDDVVSTTSQVFLGITLGCARCHDHKIDPFPQRDYYRMLAFFHNTYNDIEQGEYKKSPHTLNTQTIVASQKEREAYHKKKKRLATQISELTERVQAFEKRIESIFTNPEKEDARDDKTRETLLKQKSAEALNESEHRQYQSVKSELEQLRRTKLPPLPSALAIKENGSGAPDTYVHVRGNAHRKGEKVEPGFPEVLDFSDPAIPEPSPDAATSGRRRVLADWIVDELNPLTARVIANRVWQFHFGRGIVRSPNNFGQNGEPPTHPELLEWMARFLMDNDWSLKALHKQIMTSKTYRMSSRARPDGLALDPNNDWFWRFDMRRLTAEELRDSMLALTGRLNVKMDGPSIYTDMPEEVLATASRPDAVWGDSPPSERNRRSVYIFVKRSLHEPMLKSFDMADTDSSCAARFSTTVPTQALTMLNSEFINQQSEAFAERLLREAPNNTRQQVELGLHYALNREPESQEIQESLSLIQKMKDEIGLDQLEALRRFCLMTLNLNEFVFLD